MIVHSRTRGSNSRFFRSAWCKSPIDLYKTSPIHQHGCQTSFFTFKNLSKELICAKRHIGSVAASRKKHIHLPVPDEAPSIRWPFIVRKNVKKDLLANEPVLWVFGPRGSGARSAIQNAINRPIDLDFTECKFLNQQGVVEHVIETLVEKNPFLRKGTRKGMTPFHSSRITPVTNSGNLRSPDRTVESENLALELFMALQEIDPLFEQSVIQFSKNIVSGALHNSILMQRIPPKEVRLLHKNLQDLLTSTSTSNTAEKCWCKIMSTFPNIQRGEVETIVEFITHLPEARDYPKHLRYFLTYVRLVIQWYEKEVAILESSMHENALHENAPNSALIQGDHVQGSNVNGGSVSGTTSLGVSNDWIPVTNNAEEVKNMAVKKERKSKFMRDREANVKKGSPVSADEVSPTLNKQEFPMPADAVAGKAPPLTTQSRTSSTTSSVMGSTMNPNSKPGNMSSVQAPDDCLKLAFGCCETLLRSEFMPREEGVELLQIIRHTLNPANHHAVREVSRNHGVLLHTNCGMSLLSVQPEAILSIDPLSQEMGKAICEKVLSANGIDPVKFGPMKENDENYENPHIDKERRGANMPVPYGFAQSQDEELFGRAMTEEEEEITTDVRYWDYDALFKAIGGHPAHLRMVTQAICTIASKDMIERAGFENYELVRENDNLCASLIPPKNMTHELIRRLHVSLLRKDSRIIDWQLNYMWSSPLLVNVSTMEVLETIRALTQKPYLLVPDSFDISHNIVIAMLDAGLLIPAWAPARLTFPNTLTRHKVMSWIDSEYDKLESKTKLSYNMLFYKNREKIMKDLRMV